MVPEISVPELAREDLSGVFSGNSDVERTFSENKLILDEKKRE